MNATCPPLLHVISFAAPDSRAALLAVDSALGKATAALANLRVKPVGDIVETTLTVQRIGEAGGERLAAVLAQGAGVSALRLEHRRGLS